MNGRVACARAAETRPPPEGPRGTRCGGGTAAPGHSTDWWLQRQTDSHFLTATEAERPSWGATGAASAEPPGPGVRSPFSAPHALPLHSASLPLFASSSFYSLIFPSGCKILTHNLTLIKTTVLWG